MDAIATALSGMQAASLQLDVAANNVANVSTPGFRPDQVALASAAGGGVAARVVPGPAPVLLAGVPAEAQPSGTDLISELETMIAAPIAYAANARIVSTSEQMNGYLFDRRG